MSEGPFRFPRNLRTTEVLIVEERELRDDGRPAAWRPTRNVYPPGAERDAHGVATVMAKGHSNTQYRLSIFRRIEVIQEKPKP